ncbi:MAG: hypothetical protein N2512_07510, partial [Armatimonadetes bacterium]|nr:hypothetical protein [Armatimonadota bacterium]
LVQDAGRQQLEAVETGAHAGVGQAAPDTAVRVVMLEVDGEKIACVDIQTLAELTGKSVGALRQAERRGKNAFIRHGGRRYYPYERIGELVAQLMSDRTLGRLLGVSRMTVARWRQELSPDLSAVEVLRCLQQRAQASKRKGRSDEQARQRRRGAAP